MADSSSSQLAGESQDPGLGSAEDASAASIDATSQGARLEEARKGKKKAAGSELMREELVQSALSFLKHPKVVASSDVQRRSFLENKGLTVDEIDEAFRRLLSPSSDIVSPIKSTTQGVSDHSCRITQKETKIQTKCMDDSGMPKPGTESIDPVVPSHPKSYIEIMEMIQRGERPDDIQDINDNPPDPDQPISESRMAPKPKPWEKQGEQISSLDLNSQSKSFSELGSEVQCDSADQSTGSGDSSNRDLLLLAETVPVSGAPTEDTDPSKS